LNNNFRLNNLWRWYKCGNRFWRLNDGGKRGNSCRWLGFAAWFQHRYCSDTTWHWGWAVVAQSSSNRNTQSHRNGHHTQAPGQRMGGSAQPWVPVGVSPEVVVLVCHNEPHKFRPQVPFGLSGHIAKSKGGHETQ
jgi:hypothetical protein